MTLASFLRTRSARALAAFLILMGALVLVPGTNTAEAADDGLSIAKAVGSTTIAYDETSEWTLTVETDPDVVAATGITVTDTIPDGLCPIGAGDADCPAGPSPSPAYTAAVENADGTWTLQWDLPDMAGAETVVITYSTLNRSHYQEGFADASPIVARDSWNNTVHLSGTVDGDSVNDYAAASQAGGPVPILAQVASRPAALSAPAGCGDGSSLVWNDTQADGYRIGDQVCWRVRIDFPTDLMTLGTTVTDVLPPGHLYTAADTWAYGPANTVPVANIDAAAIGTDVATLVWDVGDSGGYIDRALVLDLVFSSTIVDPTATTSGQSVTNSATVSHLNSKGAAFNSADTARIQVIEPELNLVKGIVAVNGDSTGGGNVDGVEVMEGDAVTYQLTVTNNGDLDAHAVEVWDILPDEFAVCSGNVASISNGGACLDGPNRIEWSGGATFTVPAGAAATMTYQVTIPSGIAPNETMSNNAGIRSFSSATNEIGGTFTYVPFANIDNGIGGQNTNAPTDPSHVFTAIPTIGTTRTSSVADGGNDQHWQATIGETITYTITVLVPEGTTIYSAAVVDDLPAALDLIAASHTYDGSQPLVLTEDPTTDAVEIRWPTPYTNPPGSGDDTLTLTIAARVIDIPANSRGAVVSNSAEFTWHNQDGTKRDIPTSTTTTIVEPSIAIDKDSIDSSGNDGLVVGGELVDTTLTVTNINQPNVSTAHDVVVIDTLPEGVTPTIINDGGVWAADANPGDGVGGTITWVLPTLAPGSPATPSYQVAVDDPVVVNSVFTNTVAASGSSMAGTAVGERTAGSGYAATDLVTMTSPLASITKSAIPTTATIGEVIRYSISVAIPAGSIMYDATVLDVLPDDLIFDGVASTSCAMAGTGCIPAVDVEHVYTSGQTYAFFLGDIANSGSETRVLTIVYDTHVDSTAAAGASRTNGATVSGNTIDLLPADPGFVGGPFQVSTGPATTEIALVEPDLTIDKDVSGQTGDSDWRRAAPGDFLDFTVLISNVGADLSPAYDITIVDTLPANVTDPTLISGGGTWAGGARTVTWTIPGPLHPNTSQALSYRVFVDGGLDWTDENPTAAELVNTASIPSYYGVAAAERAANGFDYLTYTDTDDDTVAVEVDLAQLGNYVWFDVDGDGAQEAGEPPLAGVDVTITYHGPDSSLGTSDDEVFSTVTAVDGSYGVDHLPGGTYTVIVDPTDLPAGMAPSYNFDATLDHTWSGSLPEDGSEARIDFGYTGTGSVGDTVWFDIDADGVRSAAEHGLGGVEMVITWLGPNGIAGGGDDAVYLTSTDAAGSYLVENLPAGSYTIVVIPSSLPAGMAPTYDADGPGPPPHAAALTLGADEDNLDQDFGYAGTGSIGNFVWFDDDGDGSQDAGEPGLVGIPIQLTWPGEDGLLGGGDDELWLATTDAAGIYLFESLPPGEYRVEVLGGLPAAAINTADPDGGGDGSAIVNLADGIDLDRVDFGFQGTASIGDAVWWDRNGDRTLTAGEPGIPGVEITLTYAGLDGVMGNGDDLTFVTITNVDGSYLFSELPEGNYRVAVTSGVPAGFFPTSDETGPADEASLVTGLATAELHLTADFAYNANGSIGDLVWLDLSADGSQDAGEPGIPGVDVYLVWYGADGSEGSPDDVTMATTTDIDGNYAFTNLPEGGYDVVIDPSSLPPGVTAVFDPDGLATVNFASLALGAGTTDQIQDFGYVGGRSIGDTVWFDRDGDGAVGDDEYGVGGVDVSVIWGGPDGIIGNADDEAFAATTDNDGGYLIGSLPPGEYLVIVDTATLPSGMVPTYDEDHTLDSQTRFTIDEGTNHDTADFGYRGSAMVGDLIWLDLNGDGAKDEVEPGLYHQTVALTWAGRDGLPGNSDDQLFESATDSSGTYSFRYLPPGEYHLAVSGPIAGVAGNSWDEDGDLDSQTTLTLADGANHRTADFGYAGTAVIGDLVWLDLDRDGNSDPGEPGLAGIEVTVTWFGPDNTLGNSDDVVLPAYTTNTVGAYGAVALPEGSYQIAVTEGVAPGLFNSGDEDSDLDGSTVVTGLSAGAIHSTADFGYAGAGSIGEFVWWDLDGDGAQDDSEPGLANIEVTLMWSGLDAAWDTADDEMFTASTGSDGSYLFENLPPGEYRVHIDTTNLPALMVQSADPDGVFDDEAVVVLGAAEANLAQSFGYRGEGAVGGQAWYDLDTDRDRDTAEPGVAGVEITVTFLGADGVSGGNDDSAFTATTDAAGRYAVPGLPSGFYAARVDATSLPAGTAVAADLDGDDPFATRFTLGAAEHKTDVDYSVTGSSSLGGAIWEDVDGDQAAGSSEIGLPGVGIIVTWQGPAGSVTVSTTSGPDGFWNLAALPSGVFTIQLDRATLPAGMAPTTPTETTIGLSTGDQATIDFGIAGLLDVGSVVWIDADGDGFAGAEEEGVSQVLVNLYDELGELVAIAETDAAGYFRIPDLAPATYLLQLDPSSLPAGLSPTWDRDGSPDLNTIVDLTTGSDVLDANFGFQVVGLPVTGFEARRLALWGTLMLLMGAALATGALLRQDQMTAIERASTVRTPVWPPPRPSEGPSADRPVPPGRLPTR